MSKDFTKYFSRKESRERKEAFLDGYVAALITNRIYDPALFLEGLQRELHIYGEIIAQQKRAENARRAQARMIMATDKTYQPIVEATSRMTFTSVGRGYATGEPAETSRNMTFADGLGEFVQHNEDFSPILSSK